MIISLLVILFFGISMGLNIAGYILIKTLLRKIAVYEQWIVDFKDDVAHTVESMRAIDKEGTFATSLNEKGNFESDDQVGQVFKELLHVVESLDQKVK
jgi:hypothetical protein